MKVCLLVLNWNAGKYISRCLDSLQKLHLDHFDLEIVVIDNGSTDNSSSFIKEKYPKLTFLRNDKNLGYAGGNNIGLKYALFHGSDFIWIVNPDVEVHPESLLQLIKAANENPKAGIFGSKCYFASGFEFHKDRYQKSDLGHVLWYAGGKIDWKNVYAIHIGMDEVDKGQFDKLSQVEFVAGESFFVRRQVFDQIGLFDSRYFLYYEENDFCQRALCAGWQLLYIPQSIIWHANAQATSAGSSLVDYYTTRNRLLFGMRYASLRTKFSLLKESLRFIISGRPWQKRGILDYYLGKFGQGSYVVGHNHH